MLLYLHTGGFHLSAASGPGVTVMAKGGRNAADHCCLTADNHTKGCNLPQLAFKVCVNHTYYVRQADCLCSTNLQGCTAISKAQYGAQLELNILNCFCVCQHCLFVCCFLPLGCPIHQTPDVRKLSLN